MKLNVGSISTVSLDSNANTFFKGREGEGYSRGHIVQRAHMQQAALIRFVFHLSSVLGFQSWSDGVLISLSYQLMLYMFVTNHHNFVCVYITELVMMCFHLPF